MLAGLVALGAWGAWGALGALGTLGALGALGARGAGAAEPPPGPLYPPTQGEVWPKPLEERKEDTYYTFDPSHFDVQVTGHNCSILWKAIHRYSYVLQQLPALSARYAPRGPRGPRAPPPQHRGRLAALSVVLEQPCEDLPHLDMDESYRLSVSATSQLRAAAVWGALRGLETFAQLFYLSDDYSEVRINTTRIRDAPRHAHRGLLVDSARHFLSPPLLLAALDAMALNKMNVLHWHLVDDQSFPYQSEQYPELSRRGAFHPALVYARADVAAVVQYAAERGIRVVPEFDVPGHTRSWGAAYPALLTPCYAGGRAAGLGPLHPLRAAAYKLLRGLLREARAAFPDRFLHLGGDEVDLQCWSSNPELAEYMRRHNMSDARELHALFMRRALPLLPARCTPVVWQEVFDEGVALPNDTLVEVWKSTADEMIPVLRAGYRVVYATEWYLDHLADTFPDLLTVDPRAELEARGAGGLARGVVGGEACMWGEMVDDANFMTRVWPRASAAAERLWSPALGAEGALRWRRGRGAGAGRWRRDPPAHDLRRAAELACRMRRRGLRTEPPAGPGFCLL